MSGQFTKEYLKELQGYPLSVKVQLTKQRIREWVHKYGEDGVYVSFSGGKDSTVLLHLVREMYPDVEAVFCDTGLEYPEIRQFVKTFDNVLWLKPKKNFRQVIEDYGYPIISKEVAQRVFDVRTQANKNDLTIEDTNLFNRHFNEDGDYCQKYPSYCIARYKYLFDSPFLISHMCCNVMKKAPFKQFEKESGKKGILATMTCESRFRRTTWLHNGCNAFDVKRPLSKPMSFWTEQDVLQYIREYEIPIASVYGNVVIDDDEQLDGQMTISDYGLAEKDYKLKTTGCYRTGCMFCAFGCTQKNWNNLTTIKETHPKIYDYIMRPWEEGGLNYKEVIDWINEHGNLHIKY